jgi:anhydro-N-acetylmuramic acid kinase
MNLGGFPMFLEENGKRIAFDISPVNTVLNFYANKFRLIMMTKDRFPDQGKLITTY